MAPFVGSLSERAFSGGELTPAAWGQVAQENYLKGLRTARNGFIQRQSGFTNRPGTAMITTTGNGANPVRLLPFIFSNNVAYALEFGNQYMRVFRAGVQINVAGLTAWSGATAYKIGDLVISGGVNYYCVQAHTNHVPPNATYWFAMTGTIFSLPTPYLTADIQNIQFVQAENILYIACAGYPVYKLTCTADTNWVFSKVNFLPLNQPAGVLTMFHGNTNQASLINVAGRNKLTGTFMALGTIGDNVNQDGSVWNLPWAPSSVGDQLVPGVNGFPNTPTQFSNQFYMVTAVDLSTGLESLPILGGFTNFKCNSIYGYMGFQVAGGFNIYAAPFAGGEPIANITEQTGQVNQSVITAVGRTNPMTITATSTQIGGVQTMNSGDLFTVNGTGIPQIDGQVFVGVVTGNVITFNGINATSFPAPVLTGASILACNTSVVTSVPHTVAQTYDATYMGAVVLGNSFQNAHPWNTSPLGLGWAAPITPGNYTYNVYKKATNGLWGFMASTSLTGFVDNGGNPDTSKAPPVYSNNFVGSGGFPSVIGVYQQRLMLANTPSAQDSVFGSNVGNLEQFTSSSPTPKDSDTIKFKVAGQQYNAISQLIDNGFLLIFTSTGELSCYGSGSAFSPGPITPTGIGLVQQAFYGGSPLLRPLTIGKNVLYLQTLQAKVRELLYNYYINGYSGNDLTKDSNHLFDGYSFTSWAYQQEPDSVVWMVRNDGVLLSLTYIPEINLKAWTRNDTLGNFEQVVSIPEGNEHALYAVVNRFGGTRFVERFASRQIPLVPEIRFIQNGENYGQYKTVMVPDVTKFVFMDCSSYYDGRVQTIAPGVTMLPAAGDFKANGAGFSLASSMNFFNNGMIGQAIILYDPINGSAYRCTILNVISAVSAICRPDVDIPVYMQGANIASWALGVNAVSGLAYLNGQQVSILADGSVVSDPSNPATMETVDDGEVELDNFYAYVRVGLPYLTDMRMLNIDTPQQGMTSQDKPQLVNKVSLLVDQTRGLFASSLPPTSDALDPLENMTAYQPTDHESLGNNPHLKTGIISVAINAQWLYGGGIFVRQVAPLPMTVLSVVPAGKFMLGG